jgi:hypothetical protein
MFAIVKRTVNSGSNGTQILPKKTRLLNDTERVFGTGDLLFEGNIEVTASGIS